jgi:RimJ/RimL family protein N-acetyltransferase
LPPAGGVATQSVVLVSTWAFESFGAAGLQRIELLHQRDNLASCRVAQKSGFALTAVLPADPPAFPVDGHLHARYSTG